jgi:hypothetical protein
MAQAPSFKPQRACLFAQSATEDLAERFGRGARPRWSSLFA